ncbi:AN1-type zinc finger protein 5 [Schistosoma haematobium]|uniref:AN1-type zinc finger protein 5 n=1 Tax=Schistosoma haematobium TaxID=6185 RepID=A0A922LZI9_SCHHA|nr:AN1-type zinc finger protein 5 [Schistosoma haematobium]KAH9596706.1 AN1-type zinc finger protein 5 [Schistosoma haematobium]
MEENDQSQNIPLLCRKGCGFYGSPNFDGFCSKCHRSMQVQAENVQAVSRVTSDFEDKLSPERSVKITASSASTSSSGPATKTRPRCAVCHKRVGLTGFSCRCGGLYCSIHRYSDAHNCSYDYRESGQEEIRRSNPQIVCQKVQKI